MTFHIERLREHVRGRTHALFEKPNFDDAILDSHDILLESFNIYQMGILAKYIRNSGTYLYGPMWAELSINLSNNQHADLQASSEGALGIRIPHNDASPIDTNIWWDRSRNILNTYSEWSPLSNRYALYFQISPASQCIPETFSYAEASHRFSTVLEQVDCAIHAIPQ
jgi:hypothetical protein